MKGDVLLVGHEISARIFGPRAGIYVVNFILVQILGIMCVASNDPWRVCSLGVGDGILADDLEKAAEFFRAFLDPFSEFFVDFRRELVAHVGDFGHDGIGHCRIEAVAVHHEVVMAVDL